MLQKNDLNDVTGREKGVIALILMPAMANRLLELRAAKQKQIKTSEK